MPVVRFEFETPHGKFADAISYDEIDLGTGFELSPPMTPEEIEAEKHRRLENWLALIAATGG